MFFSHYLRIYFYDFLMKLSFIFAKIGSSILMIFDEKILLYLVVVKSNIVFLRIMFDKIALSVKHKTN